MGNQHEKIRSQFQKQASNFSRKGSSQTNDRYIQWILESLNLGSDDRVLDVAAGTGILSRAMAPRCRQVTAIDLSTHMLKQGQNETMDAGITNINFVEGVAEKLPFEDHQFDIVVCRFAFHHIENPRQVLREMVRACKVGGTIAVIDIVSPEDDHLAAVYNRYEILRDPSHVRALKRSAMSALFRQEGIFVIVDESIDVESDFEKWLSLTHPAKEIAHELICDVTNEIEGGSSTGLRPFYKNGKLYFHHTFMKIVGKVDG